MLSPFDYLVYHTQSHGLGRIGWPDLVLAHCNFFTVCFYVQIENLVRIRSVHQIRY